MSKSVNSYSNPKHFNAYTGSSPPPSKTSAKSLAAKIKGGKENANSISGNSTVASRDTTTILHPPNAKSSPFITRSVLHQKLTQYTRGSDRRQLLRLLTNPKLFPAAHDMKAVFVEDIAMAEREGARERGVLNGVKFLQSKSEPNQENKPMDSYFLQTLREICGHMCDMDGVFDVDPMALYGGLLLRLSRSVSEKDALEVITPWLAIDDLIILPVKRRHHVAATNTNANTKLPQPIDVELFVEAGAVHAKVTMTHELGLYRKSDLLSKGVNEHRLAEWSKLITKDASLTSNQMKMLADPALDKCKPWVFVDVDVVERINFGSGNNVRLLNVSVPEEKNSGYVRSEVSVC